MFAVVNYGDKQKTIFNLACRCVDVLDYLKKSCRIEEEAQIDVCDIHGEAKHLQDHPLVNAEEFIKSREHVVLLGVAEDPTSVSGKLYKPLLQDPNVVTKSFLARLQSIDGTNVAMENKKKKSLKHSPGGRRLLMMKGRKKEK